MKESWDVDKKSHSVPLNDFLHPWKECMEMQKYLPAFKIIFIISCPVPFFWSILRRWQQSPLGNFHHGLGFQKRLQPRSLDFWIDWHRLAAFQVPCFGFCLVSRHQDQSSCALILFASSWVVRRALCQGSRRLQVGCSGQAIRCPVLRRIHPVLFESFGSCRVWSRLNKLMRYPQQLGRSWKVFVPEPSSTSFATCTGYISNSVCYLHRNHPELQPSGTLQNLVCTRTLRNFISHLHRNPPESCLQSGTLSAICTGTLRNLITHLHRNPVSAPDRNPPEPHQLSGPGPSGTLSAICTRTLWNLIRYLPRNFPEPSTPDPSEICTGTLEPHQPSAPEPSRTLSATCTRTLRNLISHLHRNPPEPHQPFAPEHSGTSSAICTGRLRNPPEPSLEPGVAAAPDRTRAILG